MSDVRRPPARWTDDLTRVAGSDWMAKTGDQVLWGGLRPAVDCNRLMMMLLGELPSHLQYMYGSTDDIRNKLSRRDIDNVNRCHVNITLSSHIFLLANGNYSLVQSEQ